ncbi:type II toxin-antitoxin system HicB family antitoxin [Rodentibacter caecimuris]|uniref:type II toxin-antitoxin system HicB family antitoxin n=1 Tax=Rodentibacter caecimuris TaxID=1796644 RepID=UPI00109499CF|nr:MULTISPECIES: type II toxin-antitoxin system HicB family antitoxin [Pasteurellaceae]MCR1838518.1 type II toxin-antitoxin system HicB family antitoxin [Pasteurella caecimuris]MCU0107829.1 type II toxin-antitoxin system HicB family antitoxin [Pasteurella caecimuris]QIA76669.1 CopG family transcriptional regulator [Rodentibacter heylii]TGY50858.1 CopG family transcriptional regulator [Pasteurella caecimuris]
MLFTIGVEMPKDDKTAIGLYVPALSNDLYHCISAADKIEDILPMVTDAIHLVLEDMAETGFDFSTIKDLGFAEYQKHEDYEYCDTWLLVDIDVSEFFGKKQRINISIPQYLLHNIDNRVANNSLYRDRSHFLAVAAQKELFAGSYAGMERA